MSIRRVIGFISCLLLGMTAVASPRAKEPLTYNIGGIKTPVLGQVGLFYPVPVTRYAVIHSPGGYIDTAFAAAPQLRNMTCIVSAAASAAWQILLPGCKERYYLPWAKAQFHSAHRMFSGGFGRGPAFSEWSTLDMLKQLIKYNQKMTNHMLSSGFPMHPGEFYKHLQKETKYVGKELDRFYPWIKPVSQCHHCPLSWKRLKLHHNPALLNKQ